MMDEEIRQALTEVQEMKKMCGNINMKLTNIVTQRGQNWEAKLEAEYHRGLEEGYERGLTEGKKAFDLLDAERNAEYQRGFEEGRCIREKGCEGCMYQDKSIEHHPCGICCNAYNNRWTATDNKIEVGDEVNWIGDCFIVTRIFQPRTQKEQCDGIDDDGCVYHDVLMDDLEKTGRHFDIASILKEMQT